MARTFRNKSSFGEYLTQLIKDAGISQFDFYSEAGIAKPYFYDMMSGRTNPPPRETLERMVEVLDKHLPLNDNRRTELFNIAAISRGEIPYDISDLIMNHPEQWDRIRSTLHTLLAMKK